MLQTLPSSNTFQMVDTSKMRIGAALKLSAEWFVIAHDQKSNNERDTYYIASELRRIVGNPEDSLQQSPTIKDILGNSSPTHFLITHFNGYGFTEPEWQKTLNSLYSKVNPLFQAVACDSKGKIEEDSPIFKFHTSTSNGKINIHAAYFGTPRLIPPEKCYEKQLNVTASHN